MMRHGIVFALMAVSMVAAGSSPPSGYYGQVYTADMDYLLKTKKIYDLFAYVDQNVLIDAEYYEIGRNYDISANIEYYTNKEAVMEFLSYYKMGMLSSNSIFTYYNEEMRYEMVLLYRLFYFAKDFSTFYKTACWARLHMNPGMFVTAFTNAIAYRTDTKYIKLPAIYEIYPNFFFDSKVIRDAYHLKMTHGYKYHNYGMGFKSGEGYDGTETYYVYSNYTDMMVNPEYGYDYQLNYFMSDIGLNSFYYYFRMAYPFWMNLKDYALPSNFRGDFYYYIHKQIMSRYYLERYANGLGELEYFSWDKMNLPGFYSDITYTNGVAMPKRDWWNVVPFYKYKYVEYIKSLEHRIYEALDSGFFYDESGKQINLYTPEGLNYLGNIIEGNYDSYNLKFFGSYDAMGRDILGMNYDYPYKSTYIPSSLQYFATSLKDPAFYRLYDKIMMFFQKYKSYLPHYTKNELAFPGVKIENVDVDKMYTYYDTKDYYINNAVAVDSYKEGHSFSIKAWQYYLNYKPFTYKFSINSDKETKGIMRIFLGPAYEGSSYSDYYAYFMKYYKYFFQLDMFEMNLKSGMNNIERRSTESPFFYNYNYLGSDMYYKKIMKAIEGNEPFTYKDYAYGFPSNLMLPKGSYDGMKYQLFFYISPYEEGKMYDIPYFGKFMWYGKSFGYPLDRPLYPWFFKLENLYFKDVMIYHIKDYETKYGSSYGSQYGSQYGAGQYGMPYNSQYGSQYAGQYTGQYAGQYGSQY